eukprot:TRINITY_DN13890_c0_g1_i1.p2 TRINITY_DN13890_c0_g1~~TRINITY_DN13890_c0_g1_i1.p2  ORF type:complete len:102 (-),score=6.32 TRINITY_DN13890_c0_g1_i1:271-576(-)
MTGASYLWSMTLTRASTSSSHEWNSLTSSCTCRELSLGFLHFLSTLLWYRSFITLFIITFLHSSLRVFSLQNLLITSMQFLLEFSSSTFLAPAISMPNLST